MAWLLAVPVHEAVGLAGKLEAIGEGSVGSEAPRACLLGWVRQMTGYRFAPIPLSLVDCERTEKRSVWSSAWLRMQQRVWSGG